MRQFIDGEWDQLSTTLDDVGTLDELYQVLQKLGFSLSQNLLYRGGCARLYARKNLQGKKAVPIAFDFCCILFLGNDPATSSGYPIALKKLQDVLAFLRDIDAHPQTDLPVKITNLAEVGKMLSHLADRLEEPDVTLIGFPELIMRFEQLTDLLKKSLSLRIDLCQPVQPASATRKAISSDHHNGN
jgi:hypothetical protein